MEDKIIKLKHLYYWLFKAKPSGLKKDKPDDRDFQFGIFGFGDYKPKSQKKIIQTRRIFNQAPHNTCNWNATTTQKEVNEQCDLSRRSLVSYANKQGMISGNGFSTLRDGQKCLKDWGISDVEDAESENVWNIYTLYDIVKYTANANNHKTKSFWSISSKGDIFKNLDEDIVITTGIDWYTGFNQGGGFSAPWIISKAIGWLVGGHAIALIGYDLDYNGKQVFIFQNSYGYDWGDNGKFYIEINYFLNNNYGCWVNLDIDPIEAEQLNNNMKATEVLRDIKGTYWFIKDKKKQQINSIGGLMTVFFRMFRPLKDNVSDSELKQYNTTNKFFK